MRIHPTLAVIALVAGVSTSADATIQRTFVSSTGLDTHPCSLAQPCRGFAAALVQTSTGGEIVVLDSAGYGRVTINKSVTIAVPSGVHAAITVFSGTNGIDIPTGGIKVVLRGLAITGQGGTDGIYVSGDNQVAIERCDIGGMSGNGIHLDGVSGSLQIRDTVVHDNAGNGILLFGTLSATLDRVHVERNTLSGLIALEGAQVLARNGAFARNNRGVEIQSFSVSGGSFTGEAIAISDSNHEGLKATMTATNVLVTLTRSVVSHNPGGGVVFSAPSSGSAWAVISDNTFSNNANSIGATGAPSSFQITLARNAIADFSLVQAGETGAFFRSGGGNVITVGGSIVSIDQTTSF